MKPELLQSFGTIHLNIAAERLNRRGIQWSPEKEAENASLSRLLFIRGNKEESRGWCAHLARPICLPPTSLLFFLSPRVKGTMKGAHSHSVSEIRSNVTPVLKRTPGSGCRKRYDQWIRRRDARAASSERAFPRKSRHVSLMCRIKFSGELLSSLSLQAVVKIPRSDLHGRRSCE